MNLFKGESKAPSFEWVASLYLNRTVSMVQPSSILDIDGYKHREPNLCNFYSTFIVCKFSDDR